MNRAQVRVVDPVLSQVALDYADAEFIGGVLFPRVFVPTSGAKVIKFDRTAYLRYAMRRAPGAKTARVNFGHESDPVALFQDRLEGIVPREWLRDTRLLPGIDKSGQAVRDTQRIVLRELEIQQAELALNADNYDVNHKDTLAGTDVWTDAASKPKVKLNEYREAVRASIGAYPNVLVLTPAAFNALSEHPAVLDRFKYTSAESVTEAVLARYFDLERVVVGKSVYAADEAADFSDVWTDCVLAHVPQTGAYIGRPSYGYTYTMEGHPLVEQGYYDQSIVSYVYPIENEHRAYQTSMAAGFLIQGAA